VSIRWYGVILAAAMAVGLWLADRAARRRGLDRRRMLRAGQLGLLGGLVGARLYYVLFSWDYYRLMPWKILAVWEGGTAIHGGLLGGLLVGSGYAWWRRLPLALYLDAAAPALALGQAIGRWGNFFNEEAFGSPTGLPWGLYISPPNRPPRLADQQFFHPAFLYESLWNAGVFVLLATVLRRRFDRTPGALFLAYLGLTSLGRWWIEALRTDPLMLGPIRVSQLASVIGVALALAWLPRLTRRRAS
jgi:phosphatidylglycerol:prolipoprotein diacylglycerol transferase